MEDFPEQEYDALGAALKSQNTQTARQALPSGTLAEATTLGTEDIASRRERERLLAAQFEQSVPTSTTGQRSILLPDEGSTLNFQQAFPFTGVSGQSVFLT